MRTKNKASVIAGIETPISSMLLRWPTRDTASHNKTYAHFLQKLGCFIEICMLHGNTRAPWKYNWLRRNMSDPVEI